jgi:hypothetical protein
VKLSPICPALTAEDQAIKNEWVGVRSAAHIRYDRQRDRERDVMLAHGERSHHDTQYLRPAQRVHAQEDGSLFRQLVDPLSN